MRIPGEVTEPSDITAEWVAFSSRDIEVPAYLARRRGNSAGPALILLHEAFGPNAHIEDLARRFAAAGYTTIAPDLYHQVGRPPQDDIKQVLQKMLEVEDKQVVEDVYAAADYLRTAGSTSIGCIGFCSGGRQALLVSCSGSGLDAVVDCWGGHLDRASPDDPVSPTRPVPVIDLLEHSSCPVLLAGGAEDTNPPTDLLTAVHDRLRQHGGKSILRIYDGAGHAFLADYRPTYREGPAHALWNDILDFLRQYLN